MSVLGKTCTCCAILVALLAALIGALLAGVSGKLGLLSMLDRRINYKGERFWMGMSPYLHAGVPWGFQFEDMPNLTGKTMLVTGGNAGLGYWTVLHAARHGCSVIMGCRSQERCSRAVAKVKGEVPEAQVEPMIVDMSSFASVREFSKAFRESHSSLHSLVLNAGIRPSKFSLSVDGLESTMATNHFGHQLLYLELEDLLIATTEKEGSWASVVAVSSAAHFRRYQQDFPLTVEAVNDRSTWVDKKSYDWSKLANILFTQEVAERMQNHKVYANSVHPGAVATEMFGAASLSVSMLGPVVANWVYEHIFLQYILPSMWSGSEASLTQLYAAVSPEVPKKDIRGKYFHPIARVNEPSSDAQNRTLQKMLWRMTEDVIAWKP